MLKLAFRYIKREKKNTAICIAGIAVSVMLLFSLLQFVKDFLNLSKVS